VKLPATVKAKALRNLAGEPGAFRHEGDAWIVRLPAVSFAVVVAE